jgi:transposase
MTRREQVEQAVRNNPKMSGKKIAKMLGVSWNAVWSSDTWQSSRLRAPADQSANEQKRPLVRTAPEKIDAIRVELRKGTIYAEIAKNQRCSYATIHGVAQQHGLMRKKSRGRYRLKADEKKQSNLNPAEVHAGFSM